MKLQEDVIIISKQSIRDRALVATCGLCLLIGLMLTLGTNTKVEAEATTAATTTREYREVSITPTIEYNLPTTTEYTTTTTTTTTTEPSTTVVLKEDNPASFIWNKMKEFGWSDAVCAGILGNIMAEIGGHTLKLNIQLNSSSYYGICQWSTQYHPKVNGASLAEQVAYLAATIETEINNFGSNYHKGFSVSDFFLLETPEEVAEAFCLCYERPGSGHCSSRRQNARTAYNYFCGA